ncbi:LTA synthase family protein [Agriterribacter sp.]|uniref:LTA synthase family protein n=1 Tax=Agriterribacter sp. TaxID=2821509 RepID=UPI002CB0F738|nr:sulfatase-like hydrolase/transferase [Agriterribacter sp.]HTN07007.1 sulfatase-like hydrolase/transferase [Agriterribacter sp.]
MQTNTYSGKALERFMGNLLLNWRKTTPFLFFLRYYLFWVLIFFLQRLVFVLYYYSQFKEAGPEKMLQAFVYGLRLDLSMTGYFSAIPLLLFIAQQFTQTLFFKNTLKIYTWLLLLITTLISGGDLGIYENWGVKLNYRAVSMLAHPAEAFETSKSAPLLLLLFIMLAELVIAGIAYRLVVAKMKIPAGKLLSHEKIAYSIQLLLIPALIFLSIRGGWQQIPVNESVAYFSAYPVVNHAAVNTPWHLSSSLLKNRHSGQKNMYSYLPPGEAAERVNHLYQKCGDDSTRFILTQQRPNIVFIQLESFTADVIQELGGDSGVATNISKLIREGVLFTGIYASGVRTDQGIIALLSGFPAQPQTNIVNQPEKIEHMPFLSLALKNENYHNAFYYGGELSFGRFNAIAHRAGFDHIVGLEDFSDAGLFNKWGADDKSLLDKYVAEMQRPAQPFFSYIITSSSHEPFTVPMPAVFAGDSHNEQFKNACYFTDRSLGSFFEAVKTMDWYKNTLFVLVADHGHHLPRDRKFNEPARYHIPLIFFGDVLKEAYRGQKITGMGSQTDIATTLLKQLQITDTAFKWGNDLLNPNRKPFAFYTFDDGFAWLTAKDTLIFDNRAKRLLIPVHKSADAAMNDSLLTDGKAYMQVLYDTFLNY